MQEPGQLADCLMKQAITVQALRCINHAADNFLCGCPQSENLLCSSFPEWRSPVNSKQHMSKDRIDLDGAVAKRALDRAETGDAPLKPAHMISA
jgi:hypothetical protein